MIMPAKCSQHTFCGGQCRHEFHIVTCLAVVAAALPPDLLTVDARLSACIDSGVNLKLIRRSDGDMEKCKRWDRFVILLSQVGVCVYKPLNNL
jgi:hypothetical protein